MGKKKGKHIVPDDYYTNGVFEIARFGNNIICNNMMSPDMHKKYMQFLSNQYNKIVEEINNIVNSIRVKVSNCEPELLMNFLVSMKFLLMLNKASESQFADNEIFALHVAEYIQSVLVSTENKYIKNKKDQRLLYFDILSETESLYKKIINFINIWGAKMLTENEDTDQHILDYIVQSQLFYLVRGTRYQAFQIPFYQQMLTPFDSFFKEIYSMGADEIIEGLSKLEKSLSIDKLDSIKKLGNLMEGFHKYESIEDSDHYIKDKREKNSKIIREAIGTSLYNVKMVTDWPDDFIKDLSLNVGEDKEFFSNKEYSGWPIWNLPIERKPFIAIGEKSFCFDYYVLFDYFYRAVQRVIRSKDRKYEDGWGKIQQDTSEKLVEKLFKKLLPGCITYRGNYYHKDDENDILITYRDVLFIVEVKAGAFTYTPAITDFQSHIHSFENLVNKAGDQCVRMENYLRETSPAPIYDSSKKRRNVKAEISFQDYTQIYSFCVTIDDFNVFAAHAEKIGFVRLQNGTISISVNDLWVYSEYFASPLQFIHFLKQRKTATMIQELALIDELDHLGLYIENNVYSIHAAKMGQGHIVNYTGYREALDHYFASFYNPKLKFVKPVQKIPKLFREVITCCETHEFCKTMFSNFFLDFSFESRENLSNNIGEIFNREKEIGREIVCLNVQNGCYCIFIRQPGIRLLSDECRKKYTQGIMLFHNVDECYLIEFIFDSSQNLQDVKYELLNKSKIPIDEYDELYKIGQEGVENRTKSYLMKHNQKKLYPNDPCPCGSGKKYKKCCGKK